MVIALYPFKCKITYLHTESRRAQEMRSGWSQPTHINKFRVGKLKYRVGNIKKKFRRFALIFFFNWILPTLVQIRAGAPDSKTFYYDTVIVWSKVQEPIANSIRMLTRRARMNYNQTIIKVQPNSKWRIFKYSIHLKSHYWYWWSDDRLLACSLIVLNMTISHSIELSINKNFHADTSAVLYTSRPCITI